jgi:sphingolipid delta-4 desaturase
MYNSLVYHTSWTSLLMKFLFDPGISLFSRRSRTERGRVALDAEVKPDIDFLEGREAGTNTREVPVARGA